MSSLISSAIEVQLEIILNPLSFYSTNERLKFNIQQLQLQQLEKYYVIVI